MKKTLFFLFISLLVLMVFATCVKNDSPTAPVPTNTPNAAQTAVAGLSYISLASVPGGTFTQTDGSTAFSHTISAFKLGKYEVTYELWYMVRQWAITKGFSFANPGREGNDGSSAVPTSSKYEPVTSINWRDVIVWCNAYSQMTGFTPVYYNDSGFTTPVMDSNDGVIGSGDNPYVNWEANGYRLPTEGEWQYAASYIDGSSWTLYNYVSGDTAPYDTSTTMGNYCWNTYNSGSVTRNVGGKFPNGLGVYDMSGNAWEWCWDSWNVYPGTSIDYKGGPVDDSYRVLRGGSHISYAYALQVSYRHYNYLDYAYDYFGFRIARTD